MERSDKKRILTKILVVIAALTLLSCCFLGSTFAKYVTSSSGTGSVPVALWDIDVTDEMSTSTTFDKLSPDVDGNSHSTNSKEIVTITNNSDVAATVSYTTSIAAVWRSGATEDANFTDCSGQFQNMFTVTVINSAQDLVLEAKDNDPADSLTLSATVTWTTQSDALDTWYGIWLESVTVTFNFTATQSSELPA